MRTRSEWSTRNRNGRNAVGTGAVGACVLSAGSAVGLHHQFPQALAHHISPLPSISPPPSIDTFLPYSTCSIGAICAGVLPCAGSGQSSPTGHPSVVLRARMVASPSTTVTLSLHARSIGPLMNVCPLRNSTVPPPAARHALYAARMPALSSVWPSPTAP